MRMKGIIASLPLKLMLFVVYIFFENFSSGEFRKNYKNKNLINLSYYIVLAV